MRERPIFSRHRTQARALCCSLSNQRVLFFSFFFFRKTSRTHSRCTLSVVGCSAIDWYHGVRVIPIQCPLHRQYCMLSRPCRRTRYSTISASHEAGRWIRRWCYGTAELEAARCRCYSLGCSRDINSEQSRLLKADAVQQHCSSSREPSFFLKKKAEI